MVSALIKSTMYCIVLLHYTVFCNRSCDRIKRDCTISSHNARRTISYAAVQIDKRTNRQTRYIFIDCIADNINIMPVIIGR